MKKTLLIGSVALVVAMSSCLKDGGYTNTTQASTEALNIITSTADGTTTVSPTTYNYNFKDDSGTLTGAITTSSFVLNGSAVTLNIPETSYKTEPKYFLFNNPEGTVTGFGTYPINGAVIKLSPFANTPETFGISAPFRINLATVAQYAVATDYTIKTFPLNAIFYGETTTYYPSSDGMSSFKPGTEEGAGPMVYQLLLNIETNTAQVLIHNAKFAPPAPALGTVFLNNLSVEFSSAGVKVSGENVVPSVPEGEGFTDYPAFTFNKFALETTSADLTQCSINYTVATVFRGEVPTASYLNQNEQID